MPKAHQAAILPNAGIADTERYRPASVRPWLTLRVHADAAFAAPTQYAKALWWRLCGKRQRARNTLAPLLGASAHAYQLWLARPQNGDQRKSPIAQYAGGGKIIAIVDASTGLSGLDETLRSVTAEGVAAIVLCNTTAHALNALAYPVEKSLAAVVEAIDWQERPWLLPISAGDLLAPSAARHYRAAAAALGARVAYADDDLLEDGGKRVSPHFKPDWNRELYKHFDYLSGASIVQATREELLGVAGAPDWCRRLIATVVHESEPVHVHQMLHHRKARPAPRVPAQRFQVGESQPAVTVIIPTRNRIDLLRTCLSGLDATDYPELSVIVVDNGSDDPATLAFLNGLDPQRVKVLRDDGPFNFAAINNRAVEQVQSPMLCLLNNDIEVIEPTWLSTLMRQAVRDDVGAVGAQLLYPDGRIQHAGVVLGVGGGAAHAHRLLRPGEAGYFRRHQLPQFTSAVTAACLVVQRDRFLAVGGFDEENFAVAFNDADLCMRLNQHGWQTLYEPRAQLVHHESVSRGWDRDPVGAKRFAGELGALKRKWRTDDIVDPYHHPGLSRFSEHFVVAL